MKNTTRYLALCVAILGILLGFALPSQAQITPLNKDGSLYVVQQTGSTSKVFMLDRSTSPYTLNAFTGTATGTSILNALGYNRVDGYMYVLAAPTSATAGLYRVGKTGATTGDFQALGAVSGLPNATYYAGDVSTDGYLYVSNAALSASNKMYRINLNGPTPGTLATGPFSATEITLNASIQVGDIAFGTNGKLYENRSECPAACGGDE